MSDDTNTALVIVASGGRYFSSFSPSGRVTFAWSMSGACLFGAWRSECDDALRRLNSKGYDCLVRRVGFMSLGTPII